MSLPRPLPTGRVAVALAVVAIALAIAPPARAGDIDYKGWFVALDAALTQPAGLDQHYATALDTNTFQQELLFLDNGTGVSGEARIGYSWGTLGGLALSYWSFDNDDNLTKVDDAHYIYPTVFGGYAYNNFQTYGLGTGPFLPVTYQVDSSVKANVLDLEYSRPMEAGENFSITWLAGLRSATFEEDQRFDGSDAYPVRYIQTRHIKSDGIGPKVGAIFDFGFSKHFGLQGRMTFSFLQGSRDAFTDQTVFPDPLATPTVDSETVSQSNVRGEIREYDLRALWSYKTFDFYIGYGGSNWDGLPKDPTGGTANFSVANETGDDRDSVSFNSAHVGVVIRLGGG
jgi:hypothetical protein